MDAVGTIVATAISTTIASTAAWLIARVSLQVEQRLHLRNRIAQLNALTIQYPELEDDSWCQKWPPAERLTDRALRYDNYCCLVFNLIEDIFSFCGKNEQKMENFFVASEMIRRHKKWWTDDLADNIDGYPDRGFREYIRRHLGSE